MRTESKLGLLALLMFGFGYALVPLYDVFCDITGINGKTGTIAVADAQKMAVDLERLVTVEFDTSVNSELPWHISSVRFKMDVHPGEISEAVFVAENRSDKRLSGQAVPSVAPQQASLYFNKTECFCFTRQTLEPGERKEMLVKFVVDTDLPTKISTLTLSYTFFPVPDSNEEVAVAGLKI